MLENCREDCSEDAFCYFECNYDATSCLISCPCFENCPNGCDGCLTPFCECYDYENNPDYIYCSELYENSYNECVVECSIGDFLCLAVCLRDYETSLETCPCKSECPNGCPCAFYECVETTTIATTQTTPVKPENSVLVLSTFEGYKPPVITDANGREDYNFLFRFAENTSAYGSCSLMFKNELYVFGSENGDFYRQISKLVGCQLRRVGNLDFDHNRGACTNFNDEKVFLCFNDQSTDWKKCRFAEGPNEVYTETASSVYEHEYGNIAASKSK